MPYKPKAPEDFAAKESRQPLSCRIKVSTIDTLKKAAKKSKQTLAELMANVLDDYAEWLREREKKGE